MARPTLSLPSPLPPAFEDLFRGTSVGFSGMRPGIPDRVRDQDIPAGFPRSALLRRGGIPRYSVPGRCPGGIPDRVRDQDIDRGARGSRAAGREQRPPQ